MLYIEYPLRAMGKLLYNWIPIGTNKLLDVGCSWGYLSKMFAEKCNYCYGIDPSKTAISIAKKRYPNIYFSVDMAENTQFETNFFDVIIMSEVLEHVRNDLKTFNEMYRILKPKGYLLISVPHKGLFGFLDTENYIIFLKKRLPKLYKFIYEHKTGKKLIRYPEGYQNKHRHYSLNDFKRLIQYSDFNNNCRIVKVFRSGLILGYLYVNLTLIFGLIFGEKFTVKLFKPLQDYSANKEFWVSFGVLSSSICIKIKKEV